jgi:hypothetical protein
MRVVPLIHLRPMLVPEPRPARRVLPEPFSRGALGAYLLGCTAFWLQALGW